MIEQEYNKIWYQGCGNLLAGTEEEKKSFLQEIERKGDYFAQPKCDGIWAIVFGTRMEVFKEMCNTNRIFSRNKIEKEDYHLPFVGLDTAIVGELGYGSERATIRREKCGHNFMDVFDILFYKGKYVGDLLEIERRKILKKWYESLNFDDTKFFNILPIWFSKFVERYEKQYEGIILKKKFNGKYEPGTKSPHWIKVKKEYDWDMVIMDWEISVAETKKNQSMAKNITVGQFVNGRLKEMCKVGSLPLNVCISIAQNFSSYKGKVIVVHGFNRFKSGAIRHPSFIRFRDDKDPKNCIFQDTKEIKNL